MIDVSGLLTEAEDRMQKSLDALSHDISTIRTGRANPALVERVQVEYYGTLTPLNQLATISAPEARLLVIQPWDRAMVGTIDKALRSSELGFNPANDGQLIRVPIPPLTEERRKEYVRLVRQRAEEARVAIRNIRRTEDKRIKDMESSKENPISEDEGKRAQDQIQKLTDRYIERVNEIEKHKEAEVMEV